jgi:hypothetical protein
MILSVLLSITILHAFVSGVAFPGTFNHLAAEVEKGAAIRLRPARPLYTSPNKYIGKIARTSGKKLSCNGILYEPLGNQTFRTIL